ncbi:MAG: right-handed parallel beta-helix repeat-containing protein [Candidatus Dadabacteria bacterium]|nr:MAG: right-handed parallel beta-helix repeat-containing protein [Candidatus Dadabacteria bacterium]
MSWLRLLRIASATLACLTLIFGPAEGSAQLVGARCAQPLTAGSVPTARDCLAILLAAVGAYECKPACACEPAARGRITSTDALVCLRAATRQEADLRCLGSIPVVTTTSTTSTTSTTLPGAVSVIEVTSAAQAGPGTLRAAIEQANASAGPTTIVSRLPPGTVVQITEQLPALKAPGARLQANGLVLQGGSCVRPDGRAGCDGLLVTGPHIRVETLFVSGFTLDGIEVRGPSARGVVIVSCHCSNNGDDGLGIAAGAGPVLVLGSVFENNGFRTKGKGVLVFQGARATLRGNVIRGNRDGVTAADGAIAYLVDNEVSDNADKGVGVRSAVLLGNGNRVRTNGTLAGPNADGLRVTLGGVVRLSNTEISGNGDSGVVALDDSSVLLAGGSVVSNAGAGVVARDLARVELLSVDVRDNARSLESVPPASIARTCLGP